MEPEFHADLRRLIGELIGTASMQWEPRPTGVFDSTEASKLVDPALMGIFDIIKKHYFFVVENWKTTPVTGRPLMAIDDNKAYQPMRIDVNGFLKLKCPECGKEGTGEIVWKEERQ